MSGYILGGSVAVLRVWLMPWRAARKIRHQDESIVLMIKVLERVLAERDGLVEIK